jgi:hypothetical protein
MALDPAAVEPIEHLLARSSLGGSAWCSRCDHPRDNHRGGLCRYPVTLYEDGSYAFCRCSGFEAMTPDEWLRQHRRRQP